MELLLVNISLFATILFVYVSSVFVVALWRSDNSVMDIAYGPAFFVPALLCTILTGATSVGTLVILGCLGLWSSRLALRIYRKNRGKPEDQRYAQWRTAWSARGRWYFLIRSYLQINLLQGAVVLIVALPFLLSLTFGNEMPVVFITLGLVVYGLGLLIESVADYQLDQFLARKKAGTEPAVLMKTGLFAFSRRPNYFGETLIWWGLALMVLPVPFGYLAIASPLLITYIVTKVTGPMLEKIFIEKYPDDYRAYMAETNYFLPWFPKKSTPKK